MAGRFTTIDLTKQKSYVPGILDIENDDEIYQTRLMVVCARQSPCSTQRGMNTVCILDTAHYDLL